ncbi:hypothetical protein MHBO_005120 [Bonamia ostreae]|uniref:Minor capsid protein n=1 Tax=Bonamia ostreae TaxID=126728 RepID=A0ABV2AV55_9EUKA
MATSIKLVGFDAKRTANRLFDNNRVGTFTAETAARLMTPYVPMDSGTLSSNYRTTPFKVEYLAPYAHYQYEGSGFNFSREKHRLATAQWDKAMNKAKGKELAKEIEEFIKRG